METKPHVARYTSIEKIYGVLGEPSPFETSIDGVVVSEHFEERANDHVREGLGSYTVVIERRVSSFEEFSQFDTTAHGIASELDLVWAYVTGIPLSVPYEGRAVYAYEYWPEPEGWSSNLAEVKEQLRATAERSVIVLDSSPTMWQWMHELPLKTAVRVRAAYLRSEDHVKGLIEHHYEAKTAKNTQAKLFQFAKGLEIVKAMLPGKRNRAKENELCLEVRDSLRMGLNELFNIANNRREIRHIIRNPESKMLHSSISPEESEAFRHDADLVIRAMVSDALKIPFVVTREEDPPRSNNSANRT